ncbi:hypothetical protein [Fluviispira vulneris]|uniref:hypothetical protein n=1 Tax=Fluviispira vulneris TaxID=2763012 RepID=UPI0016467554|nr:hypothetical protein [Fluviispira vulneris]
MDNLKISHDIPLINKISLALLILNDNEFNGFIPIKWQIAKDFIKETHFFATSKEDEEYLQIFKTKLDALECEFNQILLIFTQNNNFNKQNEINVLLDKISNKLDDIKEPLFDSILDDNKIDFNIFLRSIMLILGTIALLEHNNKESLERNYFQDHLAIQNIWLKSYQYICNCIEFLFNERSKNINLKTSLQDKYTYILEDKFNFSELLQFKMEENLNITDRVAAFCNYLKQSLTIEYIETSEFIKLIHILDILRPSYFYDEDKILSKNNLSTMNWWNDFKANKLSKNLFIENLNIINEQKTNDNYLEKYKESNQENDEDSITVNSLADYFEKLANLSQIFPIPDHTQIDNNSHLFNKWYQDEFALKHWIKTTDLFKNKIKANLSVNLEIKINSYLFEAEEKFDSLLINFNHTNESNKKDQEKIINDILTLLNTIQELIYCNPKNPLATLPFFERYFILHLSILATSFTIFDNSHIQHNLKDLVKNTNLYITLLRIGCYERSQMLLKVLSNKSWNEKFFVVNKQNEHDLNSYEIVTKKTKNFSHALKQKNYLEYKRCYIDFSMLVFNKVARLQSLLKVFPVFSNENIINTYKRSEKIVRMQLEAAFINLQNQLSTEVLNDVNLKKIDLAFTDLPFESSPKSDYFKTYLSDDMDINLY